MAEPSTTFSIFGKNKSAKAFRQIKQDMNGVKSLAKNLVGPLAAAFSVVGIQRFASNTLKSADAIGKLHAATGVSTTAIQELQHAYDLAGVSQEQVGQGLTVFGKRLGKARNDTGALAEGLKKGNTQLLETVKAAGSTTEAMEIVFDAMAQAKDEAERLAIADAAFGGSGLKMAQAFADGGESFQQAREELKELGGVMSEEAIKGAEATNDTFTKVAQSIAGPFKKAFLDISKIIGENQEEIIAAAKALASGAVEVFKGLVEVTKVVAEGFDFVGKAIGTVAANVSLFFEKISDFADMGKNVVKKFLEGMIPWVKKIPIVGERMATNLEDYLAQFSPARKGPLDSELWGSQVVSKFVGGMQSLITAPAETARSIAQGVSQGFQKGADGSENAAKKIESDMDQITRIAQSAQGTLESGFTQTFDNIIKGGFKMRDVLSQVMNDIASAIFRIGVATPLAEGIVGGIKGAFGGVDLVPQFAGGGFPPVGRPSLVGERGPELFVPRQQGMIIPNHALGGGMSVSITVQNVDARGSNDPAAVEAAASRGIAKAAPQIVHAAVEAVRDGRRRDPKFFGGRA